MEHPLRPLLLAAGLLALGIPSFAAVCPDYTAKNVYDSADSAREAMENMKRGLSRLHATEGSVLPAASQAGAFQFKLAFQPKAGGRCPAVSEAVPQERFKSHAEAVNAMSLAIARASSQGGDILAVDTFVFCFESGGTRCGYSYILIR